MLSWLKGSSSLHHFQADLCSGNWVTTTKKLLMYHGDRGGLNHVQVFLHCLALTQYTEASCDPADPCTSVTHARPDSNSRGCAARAPLLLSRQVKSPTQQGYMTQPLAFLPVLQCISGVHEALWHPTLLSLAHASLLVAVSESRACQEPRLGATRNDKMRVRARGWHMVLISSWVYRRP